MGAALENSLARRAAIRSGDPVPNYESVLTTSYSRFLKRGYVVFDVGGHAGLHTAHFLKIVGWRGSVTSFEPIPHLANKLAKRFRFNFNFHPRGCALSEAIGKSDFVFVENYAEMSGLREREYFVQDAVKTIISVETSTLDHEARNLSRLDFVKIDIEGGEIDCLCGGLDTLNRLRPILSIEYGSPAYSKYGHGPETLYDLLDARGYQIADLWGNLVSDRDEWLGVVDGVYWDYFAVPRERAGDWSAKVRS